MKCWKSTEKIIYNDKRFDKDSNYKGSIVADADKHLKYSSYRVEGII